MKKLVRAIEKLYPGETPGVINNFVDLGSGKHPASATQLAKMIVSKYLVPAMSMDGQTGTTSYLAPNYYNDLAASETAMSVYNALPIIKMYNFANNTKLKPKNITPEILNDIDYEGDGHDLWLSSVAIDLVVKEFDFYGFDDIAFNLEMKWSFEIHDELYRYFKNREDFLKVTMMEIVFQ